MKFWQAISFTETDQLVAIARICEEVGFHGALVSDHVFFPEKIESKYPARNPVRSAERVQRFKFQSFHGHPTPAETKLGARVSHSG